MSRIIPLRITRGLQGALLVLSVQLPGMAAQAGPLPAGPATVLAASSIRANEGGAQQPVYGVKSRFSGSAGVVSFTTVKPRGPRPQAPRMALAPAPAPDREPSLAAAATQTPANLRAGQNGLLRNVLIDRPGGATVQGRIEAQRGVALTSRFGLRVDPLRGGARMHDGLDLAAPLGSPVVATSDGVVALAGWVGGYGNCVMLDHGGGVQTRYGHMWRLNVVPGQQVRRGSLLGYVGSTGRSTGPHLHYEVRIGGRAINPLGR